MPNFLKKIKLVLEWLTFVGAIVGSFKTKKIQT